MIITKHYVVRTLACMLGTGLWQRHRYEGGQVRLIYTIYDVDH